MPILIDGSQGHVFRQRRDTVARRADQAGGRRGQAAHGRVAGDGAAGGAPQHHRFGPDQAGGLVVAAGAATATSRFAVLLLGADGADAVTVRPDQETGRRSRL